MVVLAPIQKKYEIVLKKINNDHFQGRTNRHFRAILAIIWGRNGASSMLAQPKMRNQGCPRTWWIVFLCLI